jgi:hypothetical protein
MTANEAHYILGLLGPLDSTRRCIVVKNGQLAVVILDEPANVAPDECQIACRLHDVLGCGLLIVL